MNEVVDDSVGFTFEEDEDMDNLLADLSKLSAAKNEGQVPLQPSPS